MTDTKKMPPDLPTMVKQAITGHPGYPEFAAWCEGQMIHPYPIYFLIWQASREAVLAEIDQLKEENEAIRGEAKRQEDGLKEMLRRQNKQICALKGKRYD